MTLRFGEIPTPFGPMTAVTNDGGLVRLAFPEEEREAVLEAAADVLGGTVREGGVGSVQRELSAYFAGTLRVFSVPWSLALVPEGFGRRVLKETSKLPFGSVATYGEIASRAGSPRAGRAAGNALNANPLPIVVPCHRVVPASGGIGGYGGHENRKAALLELEGAFRPTSDALSA